MRNNTARNVLQRGVIKMRAEEKMIGYEIAIVAERKSKRVQLLVQPSVYEAIQYLAKEDDISVNEYVNTLMRNDAVKRLGRISRI